MFPPFLVAQVSAPSVPLTVEQVSPEVKDEASKLGEPIAVGGTGVKGILLSKKQYLVFRSRWGQSKKFLIGQAIPTIQGQPIETVEVISDQQEYDAEQQTITAKGGVEMRFGQATLLADTLRVNLKDNFAVAEGQVILKRGDQVLRGNRFEYYFLEDRGVVFEANGEIYQPSTSRDLRTTRSTEGGYSVYAGGSLNERLTANQPLQRITTAQGFQFAAGAIPGVEQQSETSFTRNQRGGSINRVRFQAERIDFDGKEWTAQKVRLTNDPFSPPELEIQAEQAKFRNLEPLVDEIALTDSVVVFDQTNPIPLLQNSLIVDRRDRQPGLLSFGYDGEDRGGFYVQANFNVIDNDSLRIQVSPQYLLQKAFTSSSAVSTSNPTGSDVSFASPSAFGLVSTVDLTLNNRLSFYAKGSFSSLEVDKIGDYTRAQLQLRQTLGDVNNPYDLRFQYNYRERLFNGSQGYQTVDSSYGLLLVSPFFILGDSQILFYYQASIQNISAPTDRIDLLPVNRTDNVLNLTRYQGVLSFYRTFSLWENPALPPTPEEGLKYTPVPIQPYIKVTFGLSSVTNFYSTGDTQPSLLGSVRLFGQFGHFSRPFLDYTGFDLTLSQGIRGDLSPFYFDRFVDTQVVTLGLTQQIYGPVRLGVQTSYSITANREISTDFFLEYSRRTYNLLLRYNPILQLGSINLRISDFNWNGNPGRFEGSDVRPVIQGVTRQD